MQARLLVNTREHPSGQGTIVEVEPEEVARHPRIYRAVESERREQLQAELRESGAKAREAAEFECRRHALLREEAERKRGVAVEMRAQATRMAELAELAEKNASLAEQALQGLPAPAQHAPSQPSPAAPPGQKPAQVPPHKRGRQGFHLDVSS